MNRRIFMHLIRYAACFVLVAGFSLVAWAQTAPATQPDRIGALRSPEALVRRAAGEAFEKERNSISLQLVELLEATASDPDTRYGSTRYWTIMSLGRMRIEYAVPKLIAMIDFQIDPATYPGGGRRSTRTLLYPAAIALSQIGGKQMVEEVGRLGLSTTDDTKTQLCAWILKANLGRELALAVINSQAQRASEKRNLPTLQKLLEKDEEIMPWR
jgi:hypothetical protein